MSANLDTVAVLETRELQSHEALLMSVIRDQAGSLEKAILEAEMNSADAKATSCRIGITNTQVTIEDDGCGITSREDLIEHFEKFGTPHDESENKKYGRFRMGRGQLFSFGRNVWRTGEFEMIVDIAKDGRKYTLRSGLPFVNGCKIRIYLYDALDKWRLNHTCQELIKQCRFAGIDVYLNDDKASTNPATLTDWSMETEDAYIRLENTGQLEVYNLGAYVRSFPFSHWGVGGIIVSKQALKVNFARNDIMSTCSVWKRIVKKLAEDIGAKNQQMQHRRLKDDEIRYLVSALTRSSEDAIDPATKNWVTMGIIDVTDERRVSVKELVDLVEVGSKRRPLLFAERGDRRADMAMQSGLAVCLATDQVALGSAAYTLVNLISWLRRTGENALADKVSRIRVTDLQTVLRNVKGTFETVDRQQVTARQRAWLEVLRGMVQAACWARSSIEHESGRPLAFLKQRKLYRSIEPGRSDVARMWTDCAHYIYVDTSFLDNSEFDLPTLGRMASILVHELMHETSDMQTHTHSPVFYQDYHDCVEHFIGYMLQGAQKALRTQYIWSRLEPQDRRKLQSLFFFRTPEQVQKDKEKEKAKREQKRNRQSHQAKARK